MRTNILINGLPGKMASLIVRYLNSLGHSNLFLIGSSLTGRGMPSEAECGGKKFQLIPPEEHRRHLQDLYVENVWPLLAIDFTHPLAVNNNAELYCQLSIPFIMGTTGGDREKMTERVERSDICAVIAPNMAWPVVIMQDMLEYAARKYPGAFHGYSLEVKESHQAGKADTSGTAKAMIELFHQLGIPFNEKDIFKERNPGMQEVIWDIPPEYLNAHGWHTYTMTSPDKTVKLEFTHNICGRGIYAEGTVNRALPFLMKKIEDGCRGKVFSMIDVLTEKM